MHNRSVVIGPVLTEKASKLVSENVFTFYVFFDSNKIQISSEISRKYNVKVRAVNTVVLPGKTVRRGHILGKKSGKKKAMVTLFDHQNTEDLKKLF